MSLSGQDFTEKKSIQIVLVATMAIMLSACSTTADQSGDYAAMDPLEDINRATLAFNEGVDKAVMEPVTEGYRAVTPKGIRLGLRNFLRNLRSPVDLGNQVLQGDVEGATNQTARTFINTLAGFGGIVDVAEMGGIPYEPEDFGQTLATWGVGHGAYIVMPLLGPSSIRDGAGMMVDSYLDPLRLYAFNIDEEHWHYTRTAAGVIDKREELLDVIDDLRKNSFDYYAALRSAYFQNRENLVNDGDASFSSGPAIPDYDE
ncbi:MAG: VacJ family lipoprotein [Pseudomonadota bacterium]